MDSILLKGGYNINKLVEDYKIAEINHGFINPKNIKGKSFSISEEICGWEAIPLHTVDGIAGNDGTIPTDINNKLFKKNNILLQCKYFQKILNDLNTDIYLVRIMRLKSGGYIAPHIDQFINNKNEIIRCQLPIITNKNIDFYFCNKNKKINYYLESGNLYFINAGEVTHYLKNNSDYDRVSLVIDLKPNDLIKKMINICE